MDLASTFQAINWLSVLVAALSTFFIGGLWYGPLFGRLWMAEFGYTEEQLKTRSLPLTFGGSFLLALIAALILEMFIGTESDLLAGMMAGLLAGIGWVATFVGILYLFEMRSLRFYIINAGYCVLSLALMGAILGAW